MEFEESLGAPTAGVPLRPTWMSIAQVCRRWRETVANFKDFWAYIPLQTSPYWAEVSLARSYPRPISFRLDCSTTQPGWYRRAALSALHAVVRAREVHLHSSAATDLEFRREALHLLGRSHTPKLETLSIDGTMARNFIPHDVFLHHHYTIVGLRSLTLMYCHVRPANALFHAPLVSLRLENCHSDSLLEVLCCLPHLRTLILESTPFHNASLASRNSSNVVHLLQLQHLAITNASGMIASLIKGILIPASTSFSITCTDYLDIEEPLDDTVILHVITSTLSAALSAHFERALGAGYSFPLLEITTPSSLSKRTLTLRGPVSDLPDASLPACPMPPGVPQLQLSMKWGDASTDLFSALLSAFPPTALRHVHTLGMRDDLLPRPGLRAADDQSLPHLLLHEKARDEAVRGLLAIVAMHGALPALRGLSLEGMDLNNTDVDSLVRVLVHRRRAFAGEPIRLALQNCLVSKSTIRALQNCLGSDAVDWGVRNTD